LNHPLKNGKRHLVGRAREHELPIVLPHPDKKTMRKFTLSDIPLYLIFWYKGKQFYKIPGSGFGRRNCVAILSGTKKKYLIPADTVVEVHKDAVLRTPNVFENNGKELFVICIPHEYLAEGKYRNTGQPQQ